MMNLTEFSKRKLCHIDSFTQLSWPALRSQVLASLRSLQLSPWYHGCGGPNGSHLFLMTSYRVRSHQVWQAQRCQSPQVQRSEAAGCGNGDGDGGLLDPSFPIPKCKNSASKQQKLMQEWIPSSGM